MNKLTRARITQGLGLAVGGAAVGHRIDRVMSGGAWLANTVWIALGGILIASLLVQLAQSGSEAGTPAEPR